MTIKNFHRLQVICLACLILAAGCRKNDHVPAGPPPNIHGKITPKGTPIGGTMVKTVGTAGGTISSADNTVWVDIPAGAVDSNIVFTVQPITNNTPHGIGNAFRFLPEGIHFRKPVTITFRYNDNQLTGSAPELIYPSYQDTAGVWQAITACSLDKSAKTISVQSSHFSDWSMFEYLDLVAEKSVVGTNESDNLKVEEIASLTNLSGEEVPVSDAVTSGKVTNWRISYGKGTLIATENIAEYTAPSAVPQENPATVSVDVRNIKSNQGSNGLLILTANILIQDEYMEISVNGSVTRYNYCRVYSPSSKMQIVGGTGAGNWIGIIQLNGNVVGNYTFDKPDVIGGNAATVLDGSTSYSSFYATCDPSQNYAAPGGVSIAKAAAAVSQYTEGTLTATLSHQNGCDHTSAQVVIHFRGKREI